jgi:hypothetical protein
MRIRPGRSPNAPPTVTMPARIISFRFRITLHPPLLTSVPPRPRPRQTGVWRAVRPFTGRETGVFSAQRGRFIVEITGQECGSAPHMNRCTVAVLMEGITLHPLPRPPRPVRRSRDGQPPETPPVVEATSTHIRSRPGANPRAQSADFGDRWGSLRREFPAVHRAHVLRQ